MIKDAAEHRIQQGFKTIILGCCLLICEFLFLPLYAFLEEIRTGGTNINRRCMEYINVQPMPVIFFITSIIILLGIAFLINGLKKSSKM